MKLVYVLALTGLASAPGLASAALCDPSTLEAIANSYIAAQSSGSLAPLSPYLPNSSTSGSMSYTENYSPATITSGILSSALQLAHNRSTHDTAQCATYTELIITAPPHPYVIGSQIRLSPPPSSGATTTPPAIASIDTIVTDAGDWLFNATETLYWASREDWSPVASTDQSPRAVLQAAADAYLDYFFDKSVVVPWGTPCDRLEGGSYTGNGSATDSCDVGVPNGVNLTDRRYVIDETLGSVDVFLSFEGLPDSHEFRVEDGRLRYVHTMTVMQ